MDQDRLEAAIDRWVAADLIEEETAAAIRAFEAERTAGRSTRRRLAWVLGVMGAILVGAGVVVFLATRWEDLPLVVRTVVLVLAPVLPAALSRVAVARSLPQVGHALWLLAALLVGPAVFGLAELHLPSLDAAWRLLLWGAIALPMGHALPSPFTIALGLVVLLAGAATATVGGDAWFVVALLGGVVAAARIPAATRNQSAGPVYGAVGTAAGLGLFLFVSASEGRFDQLDPAWGGLLVASATLAGTMAVAVAGAAWQERLRAGDAGLVLAPVVAAAVLAILVATGDGLTWVVAHLLVQAAFLGYVLVIAIIGVVVASRWLVNLAAAGFFLLVLLNLVLLAGELTGAAALVVAGTVLVVAAAVLERSRRAFLARLEQG